MHFHGSKFKQNFKMPMLSVLLYPDLPSTPVTTVYVGLGHVFPKLLKQKRHFLFFYPLYTKCNLLYVLFCTLIFFHTIRLKFASKLI